jgi:hypothetical protein
MLLTMMDEDFAAKKLLILRGRLGRPSRRMAAQELAA